MIRLCNSIFTVLMLFSMSLPDTTWKSMIVLNSVSAQEKNFNAKVKNPAKREAGEFADVLPQTKALDITQPLHELMVQGINTFAERAIQEAKSKREQYWNLNTTSAERYLQSVKRNRARFAENIGIRDQRLSPTGFIIPRRTLHLDPLQKRLQQFSTTSSPSDYDISTVTWPVLPQVFGEGLLIRKKLSRNVRGIVILIPDADWTPELMLIGPYPGNSGMKTDTNQVVRRLLENNCMVLIPSLIDRNSYFSGHPDVAFTNQPHREFLYRMSFELGRHVIGYEVLKIQSAIDNLELMLKNETKNRKISLLGIGEGGLIALYTAAIDQRVATTLVSGYFQEREQLWQEPIYRNVWNLLKEFGDAEITRLIAPRKLIIEASRAPEVSGPPAPKPGQRGGAAPGVIQTPKLESVQREFLKAQRVYQALQAESHLELIETPDGQGHSCSSNALQSFLKSLSPLEVPTHLTSVASLPFTSEKVLSAQVPGINDADQRQERQVKQLNQYTQHLLRTCIKQRNDFWSKADRSSLEKWNATSEQYRDYISKQFIGKIPLPLIKPNVRTRKIIEEKEYIGYEVMLDVFPDVIAGGIILLPADISQTSETKRPVIVCQHGLEGKANSTISTEARPFRSYKSFAIQLVKRGFIVYSPQNPYIGRDQFRVIQRKSNPLGRSLFSYIVPQHQQTLNWLKTLPYVDAKRIAFYGLSYGGKTAMRVPPLVKDYCLSICSADFNEWVRKNASSSSRYSYIFTGEYEIFEWNMGNVANYAELSWLMTPRPFMVERGHHDGVAPDEWVAEEYSRVRRHYNLLGIGDRTEIEFFNGPHTINGKGTFRFLHRHLNWPEPEN